MAEVEKTKVRTSRSRGAWQRDDSVAFRTVFTHRSGVQVRRGILGWYAYHVDGTPLRVATNSGGTELRPFPTKEAAQREIIREARSQVK